MRLCQLIDRTLQQFTLNGVINAAHEQLGGQFIFVEEVENIRIKEARLNMDFAVTRHQHQWGGNPLLPHLIGKVFCRAFRQTIIDQADIAATQDS